MSSLKAHRALRLEQLVRQGLVTEEERSLLIAAWAGPVTIGWLLENCLAKPLWPPAGNSVYLVSRATWQRKPYSSSCVPLYVGSNTGVSARFVTRLGDLIADAFGFYGGGTGHSSGGASLHAYCCQEGINPQQLYVGWITNCQCQRCAEGFLHEWLEPELNKNKPPRCGKHDVLERLASAFFED